MSNKIEEAKEKVTEKVTDKVAEQIAKVVIDKIRSIGNFECEDMSFTFTFKNIKISSDSDREYTRPE